MATYNHGSGWYNVEKVQLCTCLSVPHCALVFLHHFSTMQSECPLTYFSSDVAMHVCDKHCMLHYETLRSQERCNNWLRQTQVQGGVDIWNEKQDVTLSLQSKKKSRTILIKRNHTIVAVLFVQVLHLHSYRLYCGFAKSRKTQNEIQLPWFWSINYSFQCCCPIPYLSLI